MITYQEELFESILEEVKPILERHWQELANHKDIRELNPDYDKYIKLNQIGAMRIFTVRSDETLIGYIAYIVSNNLHYKDWQYAVCDVYYLSPEYRKQGVGTEMFKKAEEWLRSLGIKSTTIHMKVNHPHETLINSLGYTLTEKHFEKVL